MPSDTVQEPRDCPCGRPRDLAECCEPYMNGDRPAPDPESLMRSRYTAFALGTPKAVEYLFSAHHPDHREPSLREGLRASVADVDAWVQLEVLHASADGDCGVVEFVATYSIRGKEMQLREHSEFQRVEGRWLYVRGTVS